MKEYAIYRKKMNLEEYFSNWDDKSYKDLAEGVMHQIYEKYLLKCDVLQRDEFKCQNELCKSAKSKLTMHHVKFQKNGGKHTIRNCVTVCLACHKGFHRAKTTLQFPDKPALPSHIRGKSFRLEKTEQINWKRVKSDMRGFRKTLKNKHGIRLTMDQLLLLMKFLEVNFAEDGDDD